MARSRPTVVTDKILKTGFDVDYGTSVPYGIWLSTNANYSEWYGEVFKNNKRKMFLVRALLGYIGYDDGTGFRTKKISTGKGKFEFADSHHCGNTSKGHKRKDDKVGGGQDNRYVIYRDTHVYPEYLIEYQM